MQRFFLQSMMLAVVLFPVLPLDAAELEKVLDKELDERVLRLLTGDGEKDETTCPDNTFLCYTSCCTNAEECCTTTKGCVAVGDCAPPSPQSIMQSNELQR
jgi:hypothetical protein